jgi:hypothetical protein
MKKKNVAKKMRFAKSNDTVEGDYGEKFASENKFSRKDVKKEKKTRSEKHGKIPKSNWEI